MTIICKIKNKSVPHNEWIMNAEFDDKVIRFKRIMYESLKDKECNCELTCENGTVQCELTGGFTISVFGYGDKYTICLREDNNILSERYLKFHGVIDIEFENDLKNFFKLYQLKCDINNLDKHPKHAPF